MLKAKNRNDKGGYRRVIGVQHDFFGLAHYVVESEGGAKTYTIPFKEAKTKEVADPNPQPR